MDMTMPAAVPAVRAARTDAPRIGAWVVSLGTLITLFGLSWDIEWHIRVGPDTFFTWSHLALYSGSAVAGVASLVMVLLATAAQRAGRSFPPRAGGPAVKVFGGVFHAPLGYLISGAGAALFLLYGLLDLWWHSIYGFDAVLNTPSHVALFLSVSITMIGSIVVFAAARDRLWGRLGLLVAIPVLIIFAPVAFNGLDGFDLPVEAAVFGVLFCAPALLIMGSVLLGRGAAVKIAVALGAFQAVLWYFSPWAAEKYAGYVGLPLRDGLHAMAPELPSGIPMFLIVAALAVEALLALGSSGRLGQWLFMLLTGGLAGVLIGGGFAVQTSLTGGGGGGGLQTSEVIALVVLGLVLGLAAGYLGTRLAVMLRTLAPGSAPISAPVSALEESSR